MQKSEKITQQIDELSAMCTPILTWLEREGTPYTEIHIGRDGVKVIDTSLFIPNNKGD